MNGITLKHLRYFEALAQRGHFGRAAEACAISQPALSVQIKELESVLGAALVERGARQIRLTGLGEAFARRARDILRSVDELGDLARAAQTGFPGPLRIGVIPTIAPYLLPALIGELARRHRDLTLHPREAVTQNLIESLLAGRLDAAVVALPVSEPSLIEIPVFEEEFMLARPRSEAGQPPPDAAALREMRLLLLEEGHCFRDQALSFCGLRAPFRGDPIEASSLSTLVQMVGAGMGVTLIPEMAAAVETRSAAVVAVRLAPPRPMRRVGMVWRKTNPLAAHLRQIAAALRAAAAT